MIIFNRRIIINFLIIITSILLISILYEISLNNKRKLLIKIVDYRWNPIANIPVRFKTLEQSDQEYYTNNQGQVKFY